VIYNLWKKFARPWRPGSGNRVSNLSRQEREEADRTVRQMFLDVEGEL
jgi:hypothetical protein